MKRASFLTAIIALALPTLQAASNQRPAAPAASAAAEAPTDAEATPAEGAATEAPAEDSAPQGTPKASSTQMDECRRLRARMDAAEKALHSISKPSRSLQNRFNSTKSYVDRQLERLEQTATEIADLQNRHDSAVGQDYQFTIVTQDQRDKYVQDGTAAHRAMLADMKEKKNTRKIKGLDKFEIMRERYQGMPEYREAEEWYWRTLDDLEKKWSKMKAAEEKRRAKLQPAKRQKMEEDDDKEFKRVERELKDEGLDIAQAWYNPSPRNLRMLEHCLNKVHDAQRRRESGRDRQVEGQGKVPDLLNQFWAVMDKAREQMIAGNLEGARATLENDETFNRIIRLPRNVMPDEYKEPLREQRQHLLREIRNRESENSRTSRALESKISTFDRDSANIEARIDSLMEDIEREQAADVGESTVNVNDRPAPAPAQPSGDGEEGAAEGADTPAEEPQPAAAAPAQQPQQQQGGKKGKKAKKNN